jgi:methylglutaconyl-CoA hydratase
MIEKKYAYYYTEKRVGYIVLNRPEKRNALGPQFVKDLKELFIIAEKDKDSKVLVLKAEGEAFCAGADLAYLKELQSNTYEENLADSNNLKELFHQIYTLDKIVIAQVEGHAIAGGGGLATVCDFVFAVPEAKIGFTEVKIGFVPAIISVFIVRKIGEAKAKQLLFTGDLISTNAAKEIGLINYIDEKEKIDESVNQFASKLCETTSSDSLSLTKQLLADIWDKEYSEALNMAAKINAKARDTKDCKKGIESFLNKENLNW